MLKSLASAAENEPMIMQQVDSKGRNSALEPRTVAKQATLADFGSKSSKSIGELHKQRSVQEGSATRLLKKALINHAEELPRSFIASEGCPLPGNLS